MKTEKIMQWVLRIAVAGEFIGHGMLAIKGNAEWVGWVKQLSGLGDANAVTFLLLVGLIDVILAIIVLVRPVRPILLWMALWGFATAILRPIVGKSIWDFVERFANWGAPLALYLLLKIENKK